ncbi:MAG: hypothetical protein AAGF79_02340 [Pseudomonadota bacterium]
MPKPSDHRSGLAWPEDYDRIIARLRRDWGVGDELYLNRLLGNGRSGAHVYVADVSCPEFTGQAILKLDRVSDSGQQEKLESALHAEAIRDAPGFAERHLPRIIHSIHDADTLAILSTIAGRGLEYADAWHDISYDRQLQAIRYVARDLFEEWNHDYVLSPGLLMPQALLKSWLGYRLDPAEGGRIHSFLQDRCGISPDTPSISYDGHWYPNPLAFYDGAVEIPERLQIRAVMGRTHNDFHGFNLLIGQSEEPTEQSDPSYYMIDMAMYERWQYLFYDHAYFEFTTLLTNRGHQSAEDWVAAISPLRRYRNDVEHGLRTDDLGLVEIIRAVRQSVTDFVNTHETERLSFLESQAFLARVAVGLSFVQKRLPDDVRKKAFYYACANLKDYLKLNRVKWPKQSQELVIDAEHASLPGHGAAPEVASPVQPVTKTEPPHADTVDDKDAEAPPTPEQARRRWQSAVVALVLSAVIAVAVYYGEVVYGPLFGARDITESAVEPAGPEAAFERLSVAIMPFANANRFQDASVSEALTKEVISILTRTGTFRVPGYAVVSELRDTDAGIPQIAADLKADYVVEGRVTRLNGQLRITVSLYDADTASVVWNGLFDEPDTNANADRSRTQFAETIAVALLKPLDFSAVALAHEQTLDRQAYDAYARGITLLEQRGETLVQASLAFERAVELEPDFAAAWAALSITYNVIPHFLREAEGDTVRPTVYYRRAKDAALRALELNPNISMVQNAAGNMYQRDKQWSLAEGAFQRALELDPANHRVMQDYAGRLMVVGKPEASLELLERARELDPNNELYEMMAARVSHQLEPSQAVLDRVEEVFRTAPALREIAFRIILAIRVKRAELDEARALLASCSTCGQRFQTKALEMIDAAGQVPMEEIIYTNRDEPYLGYMFVYTYGDMDLTMDFFEYNALESNYRLQYFTVPWGMIETVGSDPKFLNLLGLMGLREYWERNGWSPMCAPSDTDVAQFACQAG